MLLYSPFKKYLTSLHMCHFDTHCVVLFSDTMNCWPYIGACRWDKSTVLKVPMDKEFAKI